MADRGESSRSIRGHELRATAIVRQLRRRGSLSRAALAEEMGVAANTLRNTIDYLVEAGVVGQHRGRLWLQPDLGFIVGVDVTKFHATIAISRFDFEPLNDVEGAGARREIPIEDPIATLEVIAELIADHLLEHVGAAGVAEKLIGVGLALPGPIVRERNPAPSRRQAAVWDRRVQAGPILPGWDDVPVAAQLARLLEHEHGIHPPRHEARRFVWVENDASAGALGVHTEVRTNLGDAAPDDLIYVRMADGIGAGIVNKGHMVAGARGFAGELGHVRVDPDGALCSACGGRGCLETLASNRTVTEQLRAVLRLAHAATSTAGATDGDGDGGSSGVPLERLLESEHPAVDRALSDAGWHVGSALAAVCAMLNPEMIVLSGAMPEHVSRRSEPASPDGAASRPFMAALQETLARDAIPQARVGLEVRTWQEVRSDAHSLSPELLGALALVVDYLGDAYLLPPIEQWIREPRSRDGALSFA